MIPVRYAQLMRLEDAPDRLGGLDDLVGQRLELGDAVPGVDSSGEQWQVEVIAVETYRDVLDHELAEAWFVDWLAVEGLDVRDLSRLGVERGDEEIIRVNLGVDDEHEG